MQQRSVLHICDCTDHLLLHTEIAHAHRISPLHTEFISCTKDSLLHTEFALAHMICSFRQHLLLHCGGYIELAVAHRPSYCTNTVRYPQRWHGTITVADAHKFCRADRICPCTRTLSAPLGKGLLMDETATTRTSLLRLYMISSTATPTAAVWHRGLAKNIILNAPNAKRQQHRGLRPKPKMTASKVQQKHRGTPGRCKAVNQVRV